jgi:hypothetical protein
MPGMGEWVVIGLFLPIFLLPFIALISILRNQFKGSSDKLIWVLVVIFLPILGSILYFAIGRAQRVI